MKIENELNTKQQKFADLYIETGNATQSYIDAGYAVNKVTAAESGSSRMLRNEKVVKYIHNKLNEKNRERIANQNEILEFLSLVMRGNESEQIPVQMNNKFKLLDKNPSIKDRIRAAELLGKRYLLFTDKINIDGNVGITYVDNVPESDEDDDNE